MYYLDGRRRRQLLVYFGKLKTHPRMSQAVPSGGARVCSRAATLKYLVAAND